MINEKQLELVWSHTLRTNASASVVKDLLSVTADDFNWEAKPYGIETDTSATYISALINCISKNLLQIKSSEWESARETWMEVWEIVSKNKNNWKESTWKTCTQAVRRENFDSNSSNVQEQILNDIPTKVWSDLTENELHAALKDALVNGDVGLVKKRYSLA